MNEVACNQRLPNGSAHRLNRRQHHRRHNQAEREPHELNNNSNVAKLLRQNSAAKEDQLAAACKNTKSLFDELGYARDYRSSSGSGSDISEDADLSNLQDVAVSTPVPTPSEPVPGSGEVNEVSFLDKRRVRSMSDGSANCNGLNPDGEPFEVFPSLPDNVLEKLGLSTKQTLKERLNEDELEQKFVSLSLAFTIDAATIRDRRERQRRCRDQTETNLNAEIERLVEKAHRLRPLCVDAETTELLTTLLAQIDVIVRAVDHAATAAERFGAVQHEERLADSVQLMISHVHTLKQQRDSARRQLQYTKRVLQDTSAPESPSKLRLGHLNTARMVTRRRASIATISQPLSDAQIGPTIDGRKFTRRTSELAIRGSVPAVGNVLSRSIRSARLELGLDLVKIRENTVENHLVAQPVTEESEEVESAVIDEIFECQTYSRKSSADLATPKTPQQQLLENEYSLLENLHNPSKLDSTHIKHKISHTFYKISRNFGNLINTWIEEGANGNMLYFCALMCFALSVISLGNILVELEYERHGVLYSISTWF